MIEKGCSDEKSVVSCLGIVNMREVEVSESTEKK